MLISFATPEVEEPELLEEVANIGKDAAEEATRVAAAEGQGHATRDAREVPKETPGSVSGLGVVVEEKVSLQTMSPPPQFDASVAAP